MPLSTQDFLSPPVASKVKQRTHLCLPSEHWYCSVCLLVFVGMDSSSHPLFSQFILSLFIKTDLYALRTNFLEIHVLLTLLPDLLE